MADEVPSERLRQYLRELKPEARDLLAAELERALLRGDAPPAASFILQELRSEARQTGRKLPRLGNPQRLFFNILEPFLVDDIPERKHRGRIPRACIDPVWTWICRDLMAQAAKTYVDQVNILLTAGETAGAEHAARAFQDLAEQRLSEVLASTKGDDALRRLASQIGMPHALENMREFAAILRAHDALGVIAARLPATIGNLADEQLENVRGLLDSPAVRHRDVFLYALLMVMSRLGSPWQLIRIAIRAAETDVAARVAESPYAVAVDVVLADIGRMIDTLCAGLKAGQSDEVARLLKDLHDAARALHTEMELSVDSAWGRQLAAARAAVAKLLQAEIGDLPGQVRRLLRPRTARDYPASALDAGDVDDVEAKLTLVAACRNYAGELAISEATRRVQSELQNYFDNGIQVLLDRLRTSPAVERTFRQSQVDAAVRFCAQLFGADYAGTLAKAADLAARDEQKVAKA
jgi:hypothetical protein